MSQSQKTAALKQISYGKCGQCGEQRGSHSSKNKTRCMYKADVSLYSAFLRINELEGEIKILKSKLLLDK